MTTTAQAPSEICDADAGGDRAVLGERRLELGQALGGGVGADALVLAELDRVALALRDEHRGDLVVEDAVLLRARAAFWWLAAANSSCSSRVRS